MTAGVEYICESYNINSSEETLDASTHVADIQAMEQQRDERGEVCEGAETMELSESLVQCLHLV